MKQIFTDKIIFIRADPLYPFNPCPNIYSIGSKLIVKFAGFMKLIFSANF